MYVCARRFAWTLSLVCLLCLCAKGAQAQSCSPSCTVSTEAELASAIATASDGDHITLASDITLTANLPVVQYSITIDGGGHFISGNDLFRGLTVGQVGGEVPSGITAYLQNLTITNTVAQGGSGGSGTAGGGGGAGVGGALFIDASATVSVSNVTLVNSAARGGTGGAGGSSGFGGGGGGGAVGAGGNQSDPSGGDGGAGFLSFVFGAGSSGDGGSAGIGGGGGGAADGTGGDGGAFGGGGGGDAGGGNGGYAGGAGAGGGSVSNGTAGLFGGSASTDTLAHGGGGGALGGAVFVSDTSSLLIDGAFSINGSSVTGGAGGGGNAGPGLAYGSGIFVEGYGNVILNPGAGQNVAIAGSIDDEFGTTGSAGTAALVKLGAGTLTLSGDNNYSGGTTLSAGTLNVSSDRNLGSTASGLGISIYDGATLGITETSTFNRSMGLQGTDNINVAAGKVATWAGQVLDGGDGSYGGLHVLGGGTLKLTNTANAFSYGVDVTGGSTVSVGDDRALGLSSGSIILGDASSSGTLQIDAPTFTSARDITLGAGGGIIDTVGSTDATLTGSISGSGGLTKAGSGSLTLKGSINFLGPIQIAGGQLHTFGANIFGPNSILTLGAGATFDFGGFSQTLAGINGAGTLTLGGATLTIGGNGASSAFSGSILGGGSVRKTGGGIFSLTGANSYSGGTFVDGGTLIANAGSVPGDLVDNATVIFDQGSDGTFGGAISGSGVFAKTGNGALTLTGTNSYSGGTVLDGGTLIGNTSSIQGTIVDNAALVLAQDTDATFQGAVAGGGLFSKKGAGALTWNGASGFTGLTSVDQGTLVMNGAFGGGVNVGTGGNLLLNGALAGDLTIAAGGSAVGAGYVNGNTTLGGNLAIPALGAQAASFSRRFSKLDTVAAPAPQFIVNGDFNALPGSSMTFTVLPNGVAPILVNGKAFLQGTHLNVTIDDPSPARVATYLALAAAGGVTSSGLSISSNTSIVPVIKNDTNSLLLTLLNLDVPLAPIAGGGSGGAVGSTIDALKKGATGDFGFVTRELTALSDAQLPGALKALSGEVHASESRVAASDSQTVTDLLRSVISDREDAADSTRDADKANGTPNAHSKMAPMWFQAAADHTTFADGGYANTGGGAGGYDLKSTDNFTAGVGFSFTQGDMVLGDGSTSALTAPRAVAYSGVGFGPFKLHLGGSAAKTKQETQRQIQFAAQVPNEFGQLVPLDNGVDRTANSVQTGISSDGWTELKDTIKYGGWTYDWKASVRRSVQARDRFTETGANSISLQGGDDSIVMKEADINVTGYKRTGKWRPRFMLEYRREFAPSLTTSDMSFEGQPDQTFETQGLPIPQHEYKGLIGITMRGNFLEYTIEYHFAKSQGETHNSIGARIHFK